MGLRRSIGPLVIALVVLLGLIGAYALYLQTVVPRFEANKKVLDAASDERMSLKIAYDKGPLQEEQWTMRDLDGLSSISYRALGRNNIQVSVDEHPTTNLNEDSDVAFLFGQLVQDGLWELTNKAPRGNTNAHYTVTVYQLINRQHGGRTYTFTDPHYWATTGGHQYTIHLTKGKPIPNLLQMSSTTLVEPRYAAVVHDFLAFGPPSFLARVAAEKKKRYGVGAS